MDAFLSLHALNALATTASMCQRRQDSQYEGETQAFSDINRMAVRLTHMFDAVAVDLRSAIDGQLVQGQRGQLARGQRPQAHAHMFSLEKASLVTEIITNHQTSKWFPRS